MKESSLQSQYISPVQFNVPLLQKPGRAPDVIKNIDYNLESQQGPAGTPKWNATFN